MAKSSIVPALAAGLLLGGCSFAPAYAPPAVDTPTAFKEGGAMTPVASADAQARRDWWAVYADPALDGLEGDLAKANNSLASAVARYDQAGALAAQAGAGLIPEIDVTGALQANRQSRNRPLRVPAGAGPDRTDNDQLGLGINYELDLWGRIRNLAAASKDQAQASAADLRGVELSLQAELADDYMALRGADAQLRLLNDTVTAYGRAYDLTHTRHQGGAASGLDEGRAETQLRTARAEIPDVKAQRALFEHAIAVLTGKTASGFSIPVADAAPTPLKTPVTAPSALLQRRPDVAAAERRAAAANAQIGVAKAAYFPTVTLGLNGGLQDAGGINLLQAPNSYWTLGPSFVGPLFDAGRRKAQVRFTEAQFAQAAADYRQTVLGAFQNVEDQLALNNQLADEADEQALAVRAAQKTQDLALTRYQLGAADFLEVVTAQTAALQIEQAALTVQTRRLQASVNLVKALGGGWSRDELPKL
ncbi:MAG TPA: efflux transporter outer membrane subunit [Caulobacteraceae bacterium]|jgi:NodT family efflux transporter outer membrane factor (OMF) lipoprotein